MVYRSRSYRSSSDLEMWLWIGLLLAAVAVGSIFYVAKSNHTSTVSFTVSDKERVCSSGTDGSVDCKYLVFTEEGDTYENRDRILQGKTRSSDLQGCLKVGQRYENVEVIGWRNGLFSWYPNIMKVPGCNA